MSEFVDVVIIGAGVIGLTIAREITRNNREVIILEKESTFGTETSSRNSEVIHSGIYYRQNSNKAKYCILGNKKLYKYCKQYGIPYKNTQKLIVATKNSQISKLNEIYKNGLKNSLNDIELLNKNDTNALEPDINAVKAILCKSSGIIDSHKFMLSLLGESQKNGAFISYNSIFKNGIILENGQFLIYVKDKFSGEITKIKANKLINCCGANSQKVSLKIKGIPKSTIPGQKLAKGNYFYSHSKTNFKHLIYPIPEEGGLGIHVTLDMSGQCKFGPDVQWVNSICYDVDIKREHLFIESIKNYWPKIEKKSLVPAYSGIRPKILVKNTIYDDFLISDFTNHNIRGYIALYGIESPGLTSSLAIASEINNKID